ncbi:DUF6480 family protein [Mycobacteroides abscessus]|uniref:DUF6480 family protein n=1 Tax=Mycobacteroides abscessus TaxID=36809 RepID=UPI000C265B74|nr:DUF6480 family protein [Mycobacteroides abscessus]
MAIKKRPTTDLPPDPEPAATPGLSKGGGTQPGDTPPASGQETQLNRPGFRSYRFPCPAVAGRPDSRSA